MESDNGKGMKVVLELCEWIGFLVSDDGGNSRNVVMSTVRANESESPSYRLSDEELISRIRYVNRCFLRFIDLTYLLPSSLISATPSYTPSPKYMVIFSRHWVEAHLLDSVQALPQVIWPSRYMHLKCRHPISARHLS